MTGVTFMKIAESVAILSLVLVLNAAHASDEMAGDSVNVSAYCEEQAELSGIEEANEKKQYMQECIDSFAVQEGDVQPAN
jgi:hypothetical protein